MLLHYLVTIETPKIAYYNRLCIASSKTWHVSKCLMFAYLKQPREQTSFLIVNSSTPVSKFSCDFSYAFLTLQRASCELGLCYDRNCNVQCLPWFLDCLWRCPCTCLVPCHGTFCVPHSCTLQPKHTSRFCTAIPSRA